MAIREGSLIETHVVQKCDPEHKGFGADNVGVKVLGC